MIRIGFVSIALFFACSIQASTLARTTAEFPEVPAPPSGEAQWVAKSMRLNGLPMTLKSFHSRMNPDAVLHYYDSWSKHRGSSASTRSSSMDWQILALKFEQFFITIQARSSDEGSHGTIAVSPSLSRASVQLETGFPIPASTKIVNLQQYDDRDAQAEHISLSSKRPPHIEARAFVQLLGGNGWSVIRQQRMQDIARGYVIEAQLGAQQALLTIFPDRVDGSSTAVIIVWRKS